MSIVLLILPTQPPDLIAGYSTFQLELAAYLGYGTDSSQWSEAETAELDRAIDEAYRYVLYPSKIPGGGMAHVWSWLRRVTTLTTVNGTATYTLPSDFGSMHSKYLTYAPTTGAAPVQRTSAHQIREWNQWQSYSGYPCYFAIEWLTPTGGDVQRQQIELYPTPNSAWVLYYEYAVLTNKLSRTRPYPLGGPRISQLMIEACKAVGEAKKNGVRGESWAIFRESLADAIAMDAATLTERTVGRMRGQYDAYDRGEPVYAIRSVSGSSYLGVG